MKSIQALPQRLQVGGVMIDFLTFEKAVDRLVSREVTGDVHLCNAYTVALAAERQDVAQSLRSASLNLPDGMPIAWVGRLRGLRKAERVCGPDLMAAVLDQGRRVELSHYLYGSTAEVLAGLEERIDSKWPGARIVGMESPPFRDLTEQELMASVQRASDAGADIVWVGMGTPKQDLIAQRMAAMGEAAYVAVGAAFDYLSGTKRRSPRWVRSLGFEWLFRLLSEPRRLWRRYLVYNFKFLRLMSTSGVNG